MENKLEETAPRRYKYGQLKVWKYSKLLVINYM